MNSMEGRAKKYGDNINTDIISPPQYMELSIEEAASHAMSAVDPHFAAAVRPGDIFVAEKNLGSGSSRETSPLTLKHLGIRAVVAVSFARIFYRNLINVGIPACACCEAGKISEGDVLRIAPGGGEIVNITAGEKYACDVLPKHILDIIDCGGLFEFIKRDRAREIV